MAFNSQMLIDWLSSRPYCWKTLLDSSTRELLNPFIETDLLAKLWFILKLWTSWTYIKDADYIYFGSTGFSKDQAYESCKAYFQWGFHFLIVSIVYNSTVGFHSFLTKHWFIGALVYIYWYSVYVYRKFYTQKYELNTHTKVSVGI